MASPPFSLSTTTPGDSDIVSQFPLNERTLRDIIQSWILANHDTNGNHALATFPFASTPSTPGASLITVYADSKGRLKYVTPDGVVNLVGVAPGIVFWTAATSTPVGYLVADGSAVSRSTYDDLFAALGTKYGVGDGSTTFNVPDLKGRVVAGEDGSSTRLSATYFGATPTQGGVGGLENYTLLTANLPPYTPTGSLTIAATVPFSSSNIFGQGAGGGDLAHSTGTTSVTFTSNSIVMNAQGGTSTPFRTVQPTIILRALIKV